MKKLIPLFFLFSNPFAHAFTPTSSLELKTGDIILQSLPCQTCKLIEEEEGRPYSHIGLVLNEAGKISIIEAGEKVQRVPLAEFLGLRKVNTKSLVLRSVEPLDHQTAALEKIFKNEFEGKNYDSDFLWNNRDERGEKYYCSELVAKMLNSFLSVPIPTKPMHYTHHRAEWIKYFHHTPPDGLPGISPSDFVKDPIANRFKRVGEI